MSAGNTKNVRDGEGWVEISKEYYDELRRDSLELHKKRNKNIIKQLRINLGCLEDIDNVEVNTLKLEIVKLIERLEDENR